MHTQQIANAAPNAILGNPDALKVLQNSRYGLIIDLNLLTKRGDYNGYYLNSAGSADLAVLNESKRIWSNTDKAANTILRMQKELIGFAQTVKNFNTISPVLFELSEEITTNKLQHGGSSGEVTAFGQLLTLMSRLERSMSGFLGPEKINPETMLSLKEQMATISNVTEELLNASDASPSTPGQDTETRKKLTELKAIFSDYQQSVLTLFGNPQNYMTVKQAKQLLLSENEELRLHLMAVQTNYPHQINLMNWSDYFMYLGFAMALLAALSSALVQWQGSRHREKEMNIRRVQADIQMKQAQNRESEAKQVNDQNQTAILRLMNELQEVADGDLTIHATVSEDITGAIADSVNYTVEELRALVGRVVAAAEQVTLASNQAEDISAALLSDSRKQSIEINSAGTAILTMVNDISDIARLATESAEVARKLEVAIAGVKFNDAADASAGSVEIPVEIRLAEICRTADQLTELTQQISQSIQQRTTSANSVAQNMQHILSVTGKTNEDVQQTAVHS